MEKTISASREIRTEPEKVFHIQRVFGNQNLKELIAEYAADKIREKSEEKSQSCGKMS